MAEGHRRQSESPLRAALCQPEERTAGGKDRTAAAVLRRQIHRPRGSCRRAAGRGDGAFRNLCGTVPGSGTGGAALRAGAGHDLPGESAWRCRPGAGSAQAAAAGGGRTPAASALGKRPDSRTDDGAGAAGDFPQPGAAALFFGRDPQRPADFL